jgi:O-antigen/teichoic acid export membrane protein
MLEGVGTVFLSNEDMNMVAIFELSTKMLIALIGLALIFFGRGMIFVVIVYPVVTIINIVIAYLFLNRKYGKISKQFKLISGLVHAKKSIPFLLFAVLNQIATRIDVILIGLILTVSSVGVYNASFRIVFLFMMISHFLGVALFPQFSKISLESTQALKTLVNDSLNIIILVCLPVAGGIFLLAPQIIDLVYGQDFIDSIIVLQILAPLVFLTFPERILSFLLASSDKQVVRAKAQGIIAIVNLTSNLILIPLIGIIGSAVSALLSYIILLTLYIIVLSKYIDYQRVVKRLIISLFGTFIYIQCILFLNIKSVPFSIAIAIVLYFISILPFNSVRNGEIKAVYSKIHL